MTTAHVPSPLAPGLAPGAPAPGGLRLRFDPAAGVLSIEWSPTVRIDIDGDGVAVVTLSPAGAPGRPTPPLVAGGEAVTLTLGEGLGAVSDGGAALTAVLWRIEGGLASGEASLAEAASPVAAPGLPPGDYRAARALRNAAGLVSAWSDPSGVATVGDFTPPPPPPPGAVPTEPTAIVTLGDQTATQGVSWDMAAILAEAPAGSSVAAVRALDGGWAGVTAAGRLTFCAPAGDGVRRVRVLLLAPDASYRLVEARIACAVGLHLAGYAEGDAYVLPRDADGWSVPEPGAEHRLLHVSPTGSADGDGLTPETAVDFARATAIMAAAIAPQVTAHSWHVLLERGAIIDWEPRWGLGGEDQLHPMVVGAYGAGPRPIISAVWQPSKQTNILFRDLDFGIDPAKALAEGLDYKSAIYRVVTGPTHPCGDHLFENCRFEHRGAHETVQNSGGSLRPFRMTFYRVIAVDTFRLKPSSGATWATGFGDRIQWLFCNSADGVRFEDVVADYIGWREGYMPDGTGPLQPPAPTSHAYYAAVGTRDHTVIESSFTRAASAGAQFRGGAHQSGSLYAENNVAFNSLSGGDEVDGEPALVALGQRHYAQDVLVTLPSNKTPWPTNGARGWGAEFRGEGHVEDMLCVDDGAGLNTAPTGVSNAFVVSDLKTGSPPAPPSRVSRRRLTVWNWGTSQDDIPPEMAGVSDSARLAAGVHAFARERYADEAATYRDVLAEWRALDRADWPTRLRPSAIVRWVQERFGYAFPDLGAGRTARFVGLAADDDTLIDGKRWDTRANWSDRAAPRDGDAVDLDGWRVVYDGMTRAAPAFHFGRGGLLDISKGRLTLAAATAGELGGVARVDRAGWLSLPGWSGAAPFAAEVLGGRLSVEGALGGAWSAVVSGGQLLLPGAAEATLGAGASLTLAGGRVGWDAAGGAGGLTLDGGALRWTIPATGPAPLLAPFRSGRFGTAAPGGARTLTLTAGTLGIDLSAVGGAGAWTLAEVDAIDGGLGGLTLDAVGVPAGLTLSLSVIAGALTLTVA